jgi:diguanylate cyclase (GGDEF)-like protein
MRLGGILGGRRSRPIALGLAGAFLLAWVIAAWLVADLQAVQRSERALADGRDKAYAQAALASSLIGQRLEQARNITKVISREPGVLAALSRVGPVADSLSREQRRAMWLADPVLAPVAARLDAVLKDASFAGILLINARGDCVASAFDGMPGAQTGTNYADRAYFRAAQRGEIGREFLVGRITNTYNLVYSVPVSRAADFLGAVVASLDLGDMSPLLVSDEVLVADEAGVVVLSRDRRHMMHVLPGAPALSLSTGQLLSRYKRTDLQQVEVAPYGEGLPVDVVRWRGGAHLLATQATSDGALKVHVLRDLGELGEIRADRHKLFMLLATSGVLLALLGLGGWNYARAALRHRTELMRLNEELALQARSDALTGCANRRRFIEVLELERQRAERYATPFCLLSLDLDRFKLVNDRHGHPCGDAVLRHLVAVVQSSLRPTDLLGRLGGEEFSVLLPQTTTPEAGIIAGRIRATVESSPARWGTQDIPVTVSIGVAQWLASDGEPVDALLARCDEAMYQAKHEGRNRVVVASHAPPDAEPGEAATRSPG